MSRPPPITLMGIFVMGLLLALILLPGIAGLIEGDFGYLRTRIERGWNNSSQESTAQAIAHIYAWSFWRIGLLEKEPLSYTVYRASHLLKGLHL